jgi:hypothetical protein
VANGRAEVFPDFTRRVKVSQRNENGKGIEDKEIPMVRNGASQRYAKYKQLGDAISF